MRSEGSMSGGTGGQDRPRNISRRELMISGGAAAASFTIVPRHVLGGAGFVAPSEKITLACVGFGTQAIREIGGILASPDVQVVAVCDVEKDGRHYLEWGKGQIRDDDPSAHRRARTGERASTTSPAAATSARRSSRPTTPGIAAGGRTGDAPPTRTSASCWTEEKDVTAVKVMTPDHTHAAISIAALKKGMNVIVHKPLANRLLEARAVIETARSAEGRHALPAGQRRGQLEAGPGDGQPRRHRNAPGDPQLVDAAHVAPVPDPADRYAPGPRGLRLDALARPIAGPAVPPQLHAHQLPRLVRVRRRLHRRHGALQPLADLPGPRAGRADQRRIDTQSRLHGFGRCLPADQERLLVPRRLHDPHEVRAEGRAGGPGYLLVRRRHQAPRARGAHGGEQGVARKRG